MVLQIMNKLFFPKIKKKNFFFKNQFFFQKSPPIFFSKIKKKKKKKKKLKNDREKKTHRIQSPKSPEFDKTLLANTGNLI